MSLTNPTQPNAPIPGANYTSDTRNYPWHRPPDITDLDEALEYIMDRLTETDAGMRYMSLIEAGTPVTTSASRRAITSRLPLSIKKSSKKRRPLKMMRLKLQKNPLLKKMVGLCPLFLKRNRLVCWATTPRR